MFEYRGQRFNEDDLTSLTVKEATNKLKKIGKDTLVRFKDSTKIYAVAVFAQDGDPKICPVYCLDPDMGFIFDGVNGTIIKCSANRLIVLEPLNSNKLSDRIFPN